MNPPREPIPGQPITANWGRDVVRYLRALTPRASPTVRPNIGTGGTTYSAVRGAVRGASSSVPRLFEMTDASEVVSETWTAKIKVTGSVLGGLTPDFPTADAAFSPGDAPPCIFLPETDTGVLWAHIEIDGTGAIITRELGFGETMPDVDDTNAYFQIGTWSINSDDPENPVLTVYNDAYGPLAVAVCRNWFSNPVTWGITITGES